MGFNFTALALGAISFLIIGVFHPIVIKGEYYFGKGCWPAFAAAGALCLLAALLIDSFFWATVMALIGFSCFWSIKELFEQEERVRKGWFPANPNRKKRQ